MTLQATVPFILTFDLIMLSMYAFAKYNTGLALECYFLISNAWHFLWVFWWMNAISIHFGEKKTIWNMNVLSYEHANKQIKCITQALAIIIIVIIFFLIKKNKPIITAVFDYIVSRMSMSKDRWKKKRPFMKMDNQTWSAFLLREAWQTCCWHKSLYC